MTNYKGMAVAGGTAFIAFVLFLLMNAPQVAIIGMIMAAVIGVLWVSNKKSTHKLDHEDEDEDDNNQEQWQVLADQVADLVKEQEAEKWNRILVDWESYTDRLKDEKAELENKLEEWRVYGNEIEASIQIQIDEAYNKGIRVGRRDGRDALQAAKMEILALKTGSGTSSEALEPFSELVPEPLEPHPEPVSEPPEPADFAESLFSDGFDGDTVAYELGTNYPELSKTAISKLAKIGKAKAIRIVNEARS